VPDTGWRCPAEFPRLEGAKVLAIDTETKDPRLLEAGPGFQRGDAQVVGISVGTDDGARWYFPMRHEGFGGNLDPDAVLRWAADELGREGQPKMGANLLYDLEGLAAEGVVVQGPFIDVQYAEPLLDEHRRSYALGALSETYLGTQGKGEAEAALYEWCALAYGGSPERKQAGNIWRAPPALVGPYAEADVDLPLRIWERQRKALERHGLLKLFEMECALIPMLLRMRQGGVRVAVDKAEAVRVDLNARIARDQERLNELAGFAVDVNVDRDLMRLWPDGPRTGKDNPSFTGAWLEHQAGDIGRLVVEVRKWNKFLGTFVDGYVLGNHVDGRVHCQFHPLRRDDAGTVSGRYSSSNPNLQNIPARDPELGPMVRGLFLPQEGEDWVALDYSQVEYRLMVHAAVGEGAEEARARYRDDPSTDYHAFTGELIEGIVGYAMDRKPVKNVNFGKIFGMGQANLVAMLGLTGEAAAEFFEAYDAALPYAKETARRAQDTAARRGYIRTVLGRRARFPFWEARDWALSKTDGYMSRAKAESLYGRAIRRARTHKALNAYTQGSGADIMKRGMLDAWEAGLFDVLTPLVTVHDELGVSAPRTPAGEEAVAELKRLMEQCVQLKVPLVVDVERGPSWGELV